MNATPSSPPSLLSAFDAPQILNSLADGAYITDLERRIVFWNRAAERITGWSAAEVIGRSCYDNILVHLDKDGHSLCGHEHCPLHRSIITGQASTEPLLLFAQHRSGSRTPVEATVAPIRNHAGKVIGGIEMFRDLTDSMQDQLRARNIQKMAVECGLPPDPRVCFETRYQPRDIVGGDFYRIDRLSADHYALLVADAMGHGVAAALCTMQLRSLWNDHRSDLDSPPRFVAVVNQRLHEVVGDAGFFGTAVYATYDAVTGRLRCVRAGHPAPLLFRSGGSVESLGAANPPLGLMHDSPYQESVVQLQPGDAVLFFTDGAIEVFDAAKHELGSDGLRQLARAQPGLATIPDFRVDMLEEQLLTYSNQIRLDDDLTLVKLLRLR
jgi:phosphoserine phosphatase RsbU/P